MIHLIDNAIIIAVVVFPALVGITIMAQQNRKEKARGREA